MVREFGAPVFAKERKPGLFDSLTGSSVIVLARQWVLTEGTPFRPNCVRGVGSAGATPTLGPATIAARPRQSPRSGSERLGLGGHRAAAALAAWPCTWTMKVGITL